MTIPSAVSGAIAGYIVTAYGRAATDVELLYWANNYTAGMDLPTIQMAIAAAGAVNREPVSNGSPTPSSAVVPAIDNTTFITCAYLTFLRRAPDAAGLQYWLAAIQAGMSQQQVIDSLIVSKEYLALPDTKAWTGSPNQDPCVHYALAASYAGGSPGFASPVTRLDMTVGPDVKDFRWGHLVVLNVKGGTDHCGFYGQVNVTSGWGAGMVLEANADGPTSTAVGLELDAKATNGGRAICFDGRNVGGAASILHVSRYVPILVDAQDETTYLHFTDAGLEYVKGGVARLL